MIKKITSLDMHIHSTSSDGEDSPVEIVQKAYDLGLEMIAITDHDSISGLESGRQKAPDLGVEFVNGVELSVSLYHQDYKEGINPMEIHILGYGFDDQNSELNRILKENQEYRQFRAGEIIFKLNSALFEEGKDQITNQEFRALQDNIEGSIGRPHLAKLLIEKGVVQDKIEAFKKYLIKCNVPKKELTFEEGCNLIRQAGGDVYLAHPHGDKDYSIMKITEDIQAQEAIICGMAPHLDGIECYHYDHTSEQSEQYVKIANTLGLRISGGSDHHGGAERERLGKVYVPPDIKDNVKRFGGK
ncbi:PHP domain-containing protein [Candidatus Woesearchaeota archaeon]|jgi:3',5'-nucleoside bisphosphate phosphatase|nr:PHP domain-containing protein [Candidatus Woesearchaeota archaeon]MBT5341951.1 PHP domain-containing protein [Candidatus Woesearchaeota archaeon]